MKKEYDESCDMWSCGVIMYLLLSGRPPFNGGYQEEIISAIKTAKYEFPRMLMYALILILIANIWRAVSAEGKDLVSLLLAKLPAKRLTAAAALKHPWFAKFAQKNKAKSPQEENMIHTLRNLKNFKAQSILQKAALTYIAIQLLSKTQEIQMREMFNIIDKDKDGELTRQELYEGYVKLYNGDTTKARQEAEAVLKKTDNNNNGVVDYTEFLIANMERNTPAMNDKTLRQAFDFYDEVV